MKRKKSKFISSPRNVLYLFIGLLSITSCFYACKKNNESSLDPKLIEFINSKDYKDQLVFKGLDINFEKSNITFDQKSTNRPVLHLVLNKEDKIVAILDVIKNTNDKILLPNDGKFFMLYRDVSKFNFNTLSGQIQLTDLNYDCHIINTLSYDKSVNIKSDFRPLNIEVMQKYSNIIESNYQYLISKEKRVKNLSIGNIRNANKIELNNSDKIFLAKVPCDGNHNGDLSFSECYSCMNASCASNSDCYTLCYGLGDAAMWVASGIPYCQTSIFASCIYLSIEYQ